jgi:Pyruvate/2-oxoacid:ferredoxin oxidoreductase gamma subunit
MDIKKIAIEAGSATMMNLVLAGCASSYIPIQTESLEQSIKDFFCKKGNKAILNNLKAYMLGKNCNLDSSASGT